MKGAETLENYDLIIILCGMVMGTIARFVTIRIDSRQVPSYPSGYLINLVTGFIASALGAVAIPALLSKDFTAVTFLALAVQHFRDVRKQEQESLETLEHSEMARRGAGYIDGIAKTYEARNYISLLTSLGTVWILTLAGFRQTFAILALAAAAGGAILCLLVNFTKSKRIGDICDISQGAIEVRGGSLYADGILVTDMLGTEIAQKLFREEGVAAVIKPRSQRHRLIVEQTGQQKAMLFDAVRSYGVKRYQFTQQNMEDGRVVVAFVPILRDAQGILESIRATPILESGRKRRYGLRKGG
ncbi:MAG TPA: YIEGIA domain-containing protein [Clostridia bacterium]|nr:YIEGIA domain-containing protein [Clostridia bacterium]